MGPVKQTQLHVSMLPIADEGWSGSMSGQRGLTHASRPAARETHPLPNQRFCSMVCRCPQKTTESSKCFHHWRKLPQTPTSNLGFWTVDLSQKQWRPEMLAREPLRISALGRGFECEAPCQRGTSWQTLLSRHLCECWAMPPHATEAPAQISPAHPLPKKCWILCRPLRVNARRPISSLARTPSGTLSPELGCNGEGPVHDCGPGQVLKPGQFFGVRDRVDPRGHEAAGGIHHWD